jgi:hypothetical protein
MSSFKKQYEIAKRLAKEANDAYQEIEIILDCTVADIAYAATIVPYLDEGITTDYLLSIVNEHAIEKLDELKSEGLNLIPATWYFNEEMYE